MIRQIIQTIFIQFSWGDVGNLSPVQTTGCPTQGQFSRFSKMVLELFLENSCDPKRASDNKLLIWLVNISFNYLCFCLLCVLVCVCTAHRAGLGINLHLGRCCCCTMQKVNVFSWGVACATFCRLPQHDRSFFAFFIFAS